MKKYSRFLSAILSVMMVFALCASTAFATSAADAVVLAGPTSDADVSGTDAAAESFLVPFGTQDYNFKDFGVKVTLPLFETLVTPETNENDAYTNLGVSTSGFIDTGYIFYACDPNMAEYAFYCAYSVTDSSKATRSYNKLDEAARAGVLSYAETSAASYSLGNITALQFEKINGVDFIHYGFDNGTATSDIYETVYNGIKYTFFMRLPALETEEDIAQKAAIVNSIKLYNGKLGFAYQGMSGLNIAAYIIIAVLALICLLLAFFLIRFSAFQKAADSSFNIFGFDFPANTESDYDEDVDEIEDFDYSDEQ